MSRDMSGIPAKTVLLIDVNSHSRAARARTLREMGMMVDCAATTSAGLSRLDSGSYSLVLVDVSADRGAAERLVAQIRTGNPRQLVAFLLGSPPYVVKSLNAVTPLPVATVSVPPRQATRSGAASAPAGNRTLSIDFGRRIRQAQGKAEVA
jgi:CheY-like chemotaxis protein